MPSPIQLMIVGAQKAGTSSLIQYLGEHPSVCTPIRPEMNFFTREDQYRVGYDKVFSLYFGCCQDESSIIMAKQAGLMYLPKIIQRLEKHNSDMRLVAILRNPVDRAYSAYWHFRRAGRETLRSFEEAIDGEQRRLKEDLQRWHHCAYLDRGVYHKQLTSLYDYFSMNQVHVFLFDDFKKAPIEVCHSIFALFDLETDFIPDVGIHYNRASIARSEKIARFLTSNNRLKRFVRSFFSNRTAFHLKSSLKRLNKKTFNQPQMKRETRARLLEYFRPHNERLSKLLDRDLSHWNQ